MKKNILIVDNSNHVTGANKSIAGFTRELSEKYNFSWAVPAGIPEAELKDLIGQQPYERFDFTEISKRVSALTNYLPHLYSNTKKLARLVEQNRISIVHMNDCFNMCGVLLKKLNKNVRVVYHVRLLRTSYISSLYGVFVGAIKSGADAIVCCSYAVGRDVGPSPISKKVIYDSESFSEGLEEPPKIRDTVNKIIYVGNILPGKGHALAVEAFSLLSNDLPCLRLHFVGKYGHNKASARFKSYLDCLIREKSLQDRVIFEGFKLNVEQEIKSADILLNLSESESFSMVSLEALKAGVPLVVSDCGGPAELFQHMRSGWLVPNKDHVAASEALRTLSENVGLRKQFAFEGKRYAYAKFNVCENARKLDALYSSLIA